MTTRIKLRRDTQANWEDINPVLALGEAGYDTTNHQIRVGDGTSHWVDLNPIGGGGGNIASPDGTQILWLDNGGELRAGDNGFDDINIGPTDNASRAHILVSQDNPYIRSEVISTTNQNYKNDMMWHDTWFSRYSKVTADAYGVQIKNAQWYGPANEYQNIWTFTKDGILDLPPRAEIRANPAGQFTGDLGGASYDNVPMDAADQSLTLTANSVMISGGRLDLGGSAKDGFVASLGPFPNDTDDFWYEAATADLDGNIYAAGGSYASSHYTIVTKFLANGYVAWNKYIDYDGTPWNGEPNSITYNAVDNKVVVATNNYNGDTTIAVFNLDPITGEVTSNQTIISPGTGIQLTDMVMPNWGSSDPVFVGRQNAGEAFFTPNVTAITQNIAQRLIVRPDTFEGNLQPDATQGTWTMFGTGITGNVAINSVNNIPTAPPTRVSGSGTGTNARFSVSYTRGGSYSISIATAGSNYNNNDVLKITGDQLGGTSPANDVTFNITTDAGAITGVSSVTGTATLNWALGLAGNPVDFVSLGTPTIYTATGTDGWLYWNGGQYMMGNVDFDQINSVTTEYNQADGNLYIGGACHAISSNNNQVAFVAKVNMDGGQIQWARAVDDYHAQGGAAAGGIVQGVVSDTDNAVISIADNNNSEITITKVDANGNLVWQRNLAPYSSLESTYGIALGDNNSVLVTAQARAYQDQSNDDLMIVKIDTDGNQVWNRMFGTMQNDGSWWEYNPRNITVTGNYYLLNGWTNGVANQRFNNSNGFVAKLPLDGTGVGRYGDFYYSQIDGGADFYTVGNTAANVITLPWRNGVTTGDEFNISSLSDISSQTESTDVLSLHVGGPGVIQGVNEIKFSNGGSITTDPEEGLVIWQRSPTQQELDAEFPANHPEYVFMGYGGDSPMNSNVAISVGDDTWGSDDGALEAIYYDLDGQRQVNIDIKGSTNGDIDNISNWHFDEDGSMYLPVQGFYQYGGCNLQANTDPAGGLITWYFSKTEYPTLMQDLQAGDKAYDPVNNAIWAPVYEFGTVGGDDANCYVTLSSTFSPGVPAIGFTNARRNGIVYPDNSKQLEAGRKVIPGWGGDYGWKKTYAAISGSESVIWIASSNNITAFRGTFRCQLNDAAVAMKIYDITGATYSGGGFGGDTDFAATSLLDLYASESDPVTFRLEKGGDGYLRLYATPPTGFGGTVYISWDITEFGYTVD